MGALQSKKSVDITASPKKGEVDGCQSMDGRLEKIEDCEKPSVNGSTRAPENDAQEVVVNGSETIVDDERIEKLEKVKDTVGDAKTNASGPEENKTEELAQTEEKEPEVKSKKDKEEKKEKKEKEKKDKLKKKWSFRSLGVSKKEKNKPKEETSKNGDVTKESELDEGAEKKSPAEEASSSGQKSPETENAKDAQNDQQATSVAIPTDPIPTTEAPTAQVTPASPVEATPASPVEATPAGVSETKGDASKVASAPISSPQNDTEPEVSSQIEETQEPIVEAAPELVDGTTAASAENATNTEITSNSQVSAATEPAAAEAPVPVEAESPMVQDSVTSELPIASSEPAPATESEKQEVMEVPSESTASNKSPVEE